MTVKLEEIKAALQAATPGPWNEEGKEIWKRDEFYSTTESKGHVWVCDVTNPQNAHLIANAPEWLTSLVAQVEDMKKVLEWYADKENYSQTLAPYDDDLRDGYWESPNIIDDGGDKARETLKRLKGESQ